MRDPRQFTREGAPFKITYVDDSHNKMAVQVDEVVSLNDNGSVWANVLKGTKKLTIYVPKVISIQEL